MDDHLKKKPHLMTDIQIKDILDTILVFSFIANSESLLSRYILLAKQHC